jgi:hypothetical protein
MIAAAARQCTPEQRAAFERRAKELANAPAAP